MTVVAEIIKEICEETGKTECDVINIIGPEAVPYANNLEEALALCKIAETKATKEHVGKIIDGYYQEVVDKLDDLDEIQKITELVFSETDSLGKMKEQIDFNRTSVKTRKILSQKIKNIKSTSRVFEIGNIISKLYFGKTISEADRNDLAIQLITKAPKIINNADKLFEFRNLIYDWGEYIKKIVEKTEECIDPKIYVLLKSEFDANCTLTKCSSIIHRTIGYKSEAIKKLNLEAISSFNLKCMFIINQAKKPFDLEEARGLVEYDSRYFDLYVFLISKWLKLSIKLSDLQPIKDGLLKNYYKFNTDILKEYVKFIHDKLQKDIKPIELEYTLTFCPDRDESLKEKVEEKYVNYYRPIIEKSEDINELNEIAKQRKYPKVSSMANEKIHCLNDLVKKRLNKLIELAITADDIDKARERLNINPSYVSNEEVAKRHEIHQSELAKAETNQQILAVYRRYRDRDYSLNNLAIRKIFDYKKTHC